MFGHYEPHAQKKAPPWRVALNQVAERVFSFGLLAIVAVFVIWLFSARRHEFDGVPERADVGTIVGSVTQPKQPGLSLVVRFRGEDHVVSFINIDVPYSVGANR